MQKDHYQIEKELGQGGFATSWLARDTRNKQLCVLKKINLAQMDTWKSLELFERECKTLKHLKHPGIPRFIEAWSHGGDGQTPPEAVLVQEYIPGKNLQQWLEDGRRFSEAEALDLALQMCEILRYLHGFSPPVIHRDIKPGNVILDENQRLYLIDFGAVKQTLSSQTQSVTMIGTFGYMPLEQMEGRSHPASDLYSLGATWVYLLSGRTPAELERKNLKLNFRPHTQLSNKFNQILDKLLEPDLDKRYSHVAELQADLLKLKQKKHSAPDLKDRLGQFWQKAPTNKRLWLGAGLLGLGIVLSLALLAKRPQTRVIVAPESAPKQVEDTGDSLGWQKSPLAPFEKLDPAPRLDSLSEAPDGTVWGLSSSALYAFSNEVPPQKWMAQALTGGYASLKWLEAGIEGEVWFGTYNSQLYRFAKEATEAIDKPDSADLTALGQWQNQLLAAYGKRLYIWNTGLGLFQVLKEFPEEVTALHTQTSAELWVGAKNHLYRYDAKQWTRVWQGESVYDDRIRAIRATEAHLYLALEKRTVEFERQRKTLAPLLVGGTVKALEVQPKQAFWLGTADTLSEGLYLRIPNSPNLYSLGYREGLPGDRFETLLRDRQNRLWLSFNYSGQGELWRAPANEVKQQLLAPKSKALPATHFKDACNAWETLKPAASDALAGDIFANKSHVFWQQELVCPFGEGFRRQDGVALLQNFQGLFLWRQRKLSHRTPPHNVYGSHSLLLDNQDEIWLARNFPYHVFRSQGRQWQAQTRQEGLSEERAPLLYQTRKGQILAAVMVKERLPLQSWDPGKERWQNTALKGPDNYISANDLLELKSGELALATDKGLFILSPDLQSAKAVSGLPYPDIQAVAEDPRGQIWVIYNRFGPGRGLSVWHPQNGQVRHLDVRSGLVPDRFQALTIDKEDRIWLMEGGMAVKVYPLQDLRKALKIP